VLEHGEDRADQHGSLEPAEHPDRLVSRIPRIPTLTSNAVELLLNDCL
jgi:hypothetical protein